MLSLKKSTAFKNIVAKTFFFLSIFTLKKSFLSVSNSSQVPLYGIIFPENKSLPVWVLTSLLKDTPGDLCNCDTTTLSAPFIINVALSVILGTSPK